MPPIETLILPPGKIISLKFSGDMTNDHRPEIDKTMAESRDLIDTQSALMEAKLQCLLDLTDFTGKYDPEIMMLFTDYVKKNSTVISKTAVYGGGLNGAMVTEAIAALAGRDNIILYPSKEEALAALSAEAQEGAA